MNKQPGSGSVSVSMKCSECSTTTTNQPSPGSSHRQKAGRMRRGGALPQARNHPIAIPNQVAVMPMQMVGLIPLVPHTVLDAIALTNCLMVVQCVEPLEIFTGIETANRYVVHDMFLRPMLYCNERSSFLGRQCDGNSRSFTMEMRDIFGAPFMNAHRHQSCCACSDFLGTEFRGNQIGLMKKDCCDSNFQILGAGCNQALHVVTPCCVDCGGTQVFPVLTSFGAKVGEIVRLYPGFLQEMFTDADTYLVHFPVDMPPIIKLLLISAVFLIDFTYFETDE